MNNNLLIVPSETDKTLIMVPVQAVKQDLITKTDYLIYVPLASKETFGTVKIGEGLSITNGVVSIDPLGVDLQSKVDKFQGKEKHKQSLIIDAEGYVTTGYAKGSIDIYHMASLKKEDAGYLRFSDDFEVFSTEDEGALVSLRIPVLEKTSQLFNDGDGKSSFATIDYVKANGGKIDIIKVNGVPQEIVDKTIELTIPSIEGLASETLVNTKAQEVLTTANKHTDDRISDLIGQAPETLDTLKEIADALAEDQTALDTLNLAIGNKVNKTLKINGKTLEQDINLTAADVGALTSFTESDPTVPDFVKNIKQDDINSWNDKVPSLRSVNGKLLTSDITLTASDVGAIDTNTYNSEVGDLQTRVGENATNISQLEAVMPNKVSDLTNDAGYITLSQVPEFTETDPTVPSWAKQPSKPTYDYSEITNTPTIPSIVGLASEDFVNAKDATTLNSSKSYTDNKVNTLKEELLGPGTSEAIDTIYELAEALQENKDVVTTLNDAITNKVDKTTKINNKTLTQDITLTKYDIGLTKVSQLENDSGYLTSYTETDPTVPSHVKNITQTDINTWNSKLSSVPSAAATTQGSVYGGTEESSNGATNLGYNARSTSRYAVAIGAGSLAEGQGAIQIGTGSNTIPNSVTFGGPNSPVNSLALYTTRNGVAGYHTVAFEEDLNNSGGSEGTSSALPIGFIIASTCKQNDAGLHLADGSELVIGGTYDAFCQYVINNQADFPVTDLATYQTELDTYGQCGKYVITDTYVRLPKITKGIESANTENEFGTSLGAGLPNITASQKIVGGGSYGLYLTDNGTEGAFGRANSVSGQLTGGSSGTTYQTLTFDASAGETKLDGTFRNDVYGKSDTVQSQTTKYYFYIVIGTVTKTDLLVDIDNIANDVNNKADKSGANIDAFTWAGLLAGETTGWLPQIKQISNVGSHSGYVQYGNVLMQWGLKGAIGGSKVSETVTLYKPYASASSYSVVSYANTGPENDYMNAQRITGVTATSFKIQSYFSETGKYAFWFTIGFAPEEA